jgi:hypothetical protein
MSDMVRNRDPVTFPPSATVRDACRSMVVGIVSRFDFSGIELDRLDAETGLWERI